MIEFKTNYTPGPWSPGLDARSTYIKTSGEFISILAPDHDILLCATSPKMAEYMMDRAKKISSGLSSDQYRFNPHDTRAIGMNEELQTILSILKDAGIEVVEK